MNIEIRRISPSHDEVRALFGLLDAHNATFCSPEACHLARPEEFERAGALLLGVFRDGALCGMGGLKFFDDYAEVSRMFIVEEQRGKGLAVALLGRLEMEAAERGKAALRLETSDRFERAFRLYRRYGFHPCEPFGEYVHAEFQHAYMEKRLG